MTLKIEASHSKKFAIIEAGSKQYKVFDNDVIEIEKTGKAVGETINPRVLAICDEANQIFRFNIKGNPIVSEISLKVIEHDRKDKVLIFKRKRRKNHQRLNGHKQHVDLAKVTIGGA